MGSFINTYRISRLLTYLSIKINVMKDSKKQIDIDKKNNLIEENIFTKEDLRNILGGTTDRELDLDSTGENETVASDNLT